MSAQVNRNILGDVYAYNQLATIFSAAELINYKDSLLKQYSKLTKNWTNEQHSEWIARMYLAAKMIYSSTLLLNTLEFSQRKNIRVTEPYLLYYSIFNCCRALTFAHPTQIWRNGKLISESHAKVINNSVEIISCLNKQKSADLKNIIESAKDYRELFSYKFPANGLRQEGIFNNINLENISYECNLICEIAQLTSECFQKSFEKNCSNGNYSLDIKILEACFSYQSNNYMLTDDDDSYRILYIMKKVKRPYNIYYTMTEGMTDDFFGSWVITDENEQDSFDPDRKTINIFNIP